MSPRRLMMRAACCSAFRRARRLALSRFLERGDDAAPLAVSGARWHGASDAIVEADQADGVALSQQQQRDRRGEPLGVFEFRQSVGRAAPGHRAADVEHDGRAEVGFFLVLADDPAVGARGDLPVDVAEVVAGLVRAVVGELDGESLSGRAMEPGHEAVDDPPGNNLNAPQGREARWVEEIGAEGLGALHWSGKAKRRG